MIFLTFYQLSSILSSCSLLCFPSTLDLQHCLKVQGGRCNATKDDLKINLGAALNLGGRYTTSRVTVEFAGNEGHHKPTRSLVMHEHMVCS